MRFPFPPARIIAEYAILPLVSDVSRLFHTEMPAIAYDHMVKKRDSHYIPGLDKLLCYFDIFPAWGRVAGRMIVSYYYMSCGCCQCEPEYFPRMHDICVQ